MKPWVNDLLVLYFIGWLIGLVFGFFRWVLTEKGTFLSHIAPAFVWPLAVIKECWKYLRK